MKIPDTYRPAAKAKAERLLAAEPDEERQQRILNEISEEEWRLDKIEWNAWMRMMSAKHMHRTPAERVAAEKRKANHV